MSHASKAQKTWNVWNEHRSLGPRAKPLPPRQSWWLGLDRETFNAKAQAETPRMMMAVEATWVPQPIIGWRA